MNKVDKYAHLHTKFDQRIHASNSGGLALLRAGLIEFLGTATIIILTGCLTIHYAPQTAYEPYIPLAVTYGILIIGAGPIS